MFSYQSDDVDACQMAIVEADKYLPAAQADLLYRFREYSPSIRMFERGIALAIDEGDFDRGLTLCNAAIALGLGPSYQAKRASIERMI